MTTSDDFCVGFKNLSLSQPVHFLIDADRKTSPVMAGYTAIEYTISCTAVGTFGCDIIFIRETCSPYFQPQNQKLTVDLIKYCTLLK